MWSPESMTPDIDDSGCGASFLVHLLKMQIFIFTEHCTFKLRKNSNDNVELGIDKEVFKRI